MKSQQIIALLKAKAVNNGTSTRPVLYLAIYADGAVRISSMNGTNLSITDQLTDKTVGEAEFVYKVWNRRETPNLLCVYAGAKTTRVWEVVEE